jgi:hypothetical protein
MNRYETQAFQNMPYKEKTDLLADVKRKWPMDFAMQSFEFEGQAAAWQTLETWERSGIPGLAFKPLNSVPLNHVYLSKPMRMQFGVQGVSDDLHGVFISCANL